MIEVAIKNKISDKFSPLHFHLENESHQHAGPQSESHFKVFVVSDAFKNLSRLERQRMVMETLKEEFAKGLHALSMRLYTSEEFSQKEGLSFKSPNCIGKNK